MDTMQEALAAVGEEKLEQVTAGNVMKFPAGKTLIAVELGRDESVSGARTTLVRANWQFAGRAVAIKNGDCVAANYLFAHVSKGVPKVTGCHLVSRKGDSTPTLLPLAVWPAKEVARRAGVSDDELEQLSGGEILAKYAPEWQEDAETEERGLDQLADRALKALEQASEVGPFLGPVAFRVRPVEEAVDLGKEWVWLMEAMRRNNKAAVPFQAGAEGDIIVHNPGFWLGYVDDLHATGLFFVEKGGERRKRGDREVRFNPHYVNGL